MKKQPLTARQAQVYAYLVDFFKVYRRAPSVREACEYFDVSMGPGMTQIWDILERKGYIVRTKGKYRAIRLVGQTCSHCDGLGTVLKNKPEPVVVGKPLSFMTVEDFQEEFGVEESGDHRA